MGARKSSRYPGILCHMSEVYQMRACDVRSPHLCMAWRALFSAERQSHLPMMCMLPAVSWHCSGVRLGDTPMGRTSKGRLAVVWSTMCRVHVAHTCQAYGLFSLPVGEGEPVLRGMSVIITMYVVHAGRGQLRLEYIRCEVPSVYSLTGWRDRRD
jgi:hypothetical protein